MANSNGKQSKESKAVVEPAEPVEAAPVVAVEVIPPNAVVASTVAPTAEAPAGFASAFDASFDVSKLSQKSLDIWNENATAFFELAESLASAKTIDEVTTLQTRFFTKRLDSLFRQSTELLTLAQKMMTVTVTPLYGKAA